MSVKSSIVVLIFMLIAGQTAFGLGSKKPKSKSKYIKKYSYVDEDQKINRKALNKALEYYDKKYYDMDNKDYLTVIDFSKHSKYRRFYVIDMNSGKVYPYHTAHGKNTDKNHDGYADDFSNVSGSKQSSLGLYKTAETYYGKYGYSLKLDGLSSSNSKARSRAIVIHPAKYVKAGMSKMGRSWGCPALDPKVSESIIKRIKEGSLIYAYFK